MTSTDYSTPPDHELRQWLLLTSQGDQMAFSRLLGHYWNKVYAQALTYLKSAEWAQELTQDVFVKIWNVRDKLPGVHNFSDYLFIISRNELISALRKKREKLIEPNENVEELLMRPDHQMQYKESYIKILDLIERLPPTRKQVFTLSRLEGKSYEEIGSLMGISRNGVKDHVVKALNFLRTHFYLNEEKIILTVISLLAIKYF